MGRKPVEGLERVFADPFALSHQVAPMTSIDRDRHQLSFRHFWIIKHQPYLAASPACEANEAQENALIKPSVFALRSACN